MANIQLARNLRFRRRVLGYTQEDVGNMLNISRQAYSNYETGARMPDLDCLVRLCEILQVTLDELAELSGEFGFLTEEITEGDFLENAKEFPGIIYRIRVEM